MTDTIEITVDGTALLGGILAGTVFVLPNVAPLLLSGSGIAAIASNAPLFQVIGVVVLLGTVYRSADIGGNAIGVPREALYPAIVAFVLMVGLGYAAIPASSALAGSNAEQVTGDNLRVVTLEVEGMVCQGCRLTVKNYLESMSGTERVTVTLSKKQATVVYDADTVTAESIANSDVFRGAYSATIASDREYSG